MEDDKQNDEIIASTFASLLVELFFAALPLFILSLTWPAKHEEHPTAFIRGPEISMTACILYGLTLTRYYEGILEFLRLSPSNRKMNIHKLILMSLAPLSGVIFSVLLIAKLATDTDGNFWIVLQMVNVIFSAVCFMFLGGWGMKRAEMTR